MLRKICEFNRSIIFEISTFFGRYSQHHCLLHFCRLLDWHPMHLISWKNLVLNTHFFLLHVQPLEYVHPLISQWTKTWKNITDKYFFRKRLNIIFRFVLNTQHTFHLRNKKMKEFRIYMIAAHRMCIRTMLQCMQYIVYVQGVDQKYFWTWNKIIYCSALHKFNIHYTRLRILKIWLKF